MGLSEVKNWTSTDNNKTSQVHKGFYINVKILSQVLPGAPWRQDSLAHAVALCGSSRTRHISQFHSHLGVDLGSDADAVVS